MRDVARSSVPICQWSNLSNSMLESPPRSVAKAIVRPSGDHCGCISAYLSFVSCCSLPVARSTMKRSLIPLL
jgi:hypothetical protein